MFVFFEMYIVHEEMVIQFIVNSLALLLDNSIIYHLYVNIRV